MAEGLPSVLVAGGTGALGAAVLGELLESGYPVTATWVVPEERERVEEDFGGHDRLTLVEADVMREQAVLEALMSVGHLGAIVNLVGGFSAPGKVHESTVDDFESMLRLNLRPAFLLAHVGIPRLVQMGGGAFVCVSARPALRPFAGAAGYATAKAGVLAFIHALDTEYRNEGVRCNAILPSVIDTPANRAGQPDADYSKWVPPQQIAKVIRFLVSDDSLPISGAAVPVYGRA
ncbi:MAG TPA: SDR family NAD(P)-dependent oxidoreductase [Thermoleophilaceae bacterium]|nr:SDR family NAD(P)-dependent oxidoreductase [Thermoleophilaceae bacterium]